MSEGYDMDKSAETTENTPSINRRRFVKALGAGAATTTFGVGVGSAKTSSALGDYDELTGREKLDLLGILRETSEFEQLRDIAHEHGGTLRGIRGHSRAGRLTANGTTREIVTIELKIDRGDDAYLTIGRDVGEGVSIGMVEYNTYADDGILQKHVAYDVVSQGGEATTSEVSVQSINTDVTKKVVTPEEKIRKIVNEINADSKSGTTNGFSTMGFGNGPCDECMWAVPLVCLNLCGIGGGFACGFFGIISGGIGGVGCLTIVGVVCALSAHYACNDSKLNDKACNQLGLC
jgi:halocin C8-like bacteriocin domain-containing protein